ncbi:hypothetical protein fh0823_22400 [Francisella halioticida]|uniref:Uncharacterized protein n=1 Tax=Francisella halioticida TaxID=549298 RepID=A0ABN5B0H7_9GAMM|nr:hypothetical protein [Francisella halioticida]ASG67195.1 hypothetical protein CDV26_01250 [Francisella halioticida]BCD92101.1 hypothetical protein fh0823_22400 [Francisella halioticida]
MCKLNFVPMLMDDLLRLLVSVFLFICCVILGCIFIKKKSWDIPFWIFFALFLFSLGGCGYIVHHIYLENTFSYDGFISSAAFITVCGLLFSRHHYVDFTDKLLSKNAPILFATFFVFAFIYVLTIKYDPNCQVFPHEIFITILQIVVYPLLLLFGISAFLYRFSICISAFAIGMALFLVENVIFIAHALFTEMGDEQLLEEIICATISIILSIIAICILTYSKKIYKERLNASS